MNILKFIWAAICLVLLLVMALVISEKMEVSLFSGFLSVSCWVSMNGLIEWADDAAWEGEALPVSYKFMFAAWIGLILLTIVSWGSE